MRRYFLFSLLLIGSGSANAGWLDVVFGVYDQAVENTSKHFETADGVRKQVISNTSRHMETWASASDDVNPGCVRLAARGMYEAGAYTGIIGSGATWMAPILSSPPVALTVAAVSTAAAANAAYHCLN